MLKHSNTLKKFFKNLLLFWHSFQVKKTFYLMSLEHVGGSAWFGPRCTLKCSDSLKKKKEKRFCCCSHVVCFQVKPSFCAPCSGKVSLQSLRLQEEYSQQLEEQRRRYEETLQDQCRHERDQAQVTVFCVWGNGQDGGEGWGGVGAKKGIKERGRKVLGRRGGEIK